MNNVVLCVEFSNNIVQTIWHGVKELNKIRFGFFNVN